MWCGQRGSGDKGQPGLYRFLHELVVQGPGYGGIYAKREAGQTGGLLNRFPGSMSVYYELAERGYLADLIAGGVHVS